MIIGKVAVDLHATVIHVPDSQMAEFAPLFQGLMDRLRAVDMRRVYDHARFETVFGIVHMMPFEALYPDPTWYHEAQAAAAARDGAAYDLMLDDIREEWESAHDFRV